MSFWPRLRRRSRGRKRSSSRPNPYASIGLDKLAVVHAEFDAQRALFAAEKGVPVSFVRFISGSPRGWTLLPRSAVSPSPSPEEEDNQSSTSSSASSSTARGFAPFPASPSLSPRLRSQRPQHSGASKSASEAQPTQSLFQSPRPDSIHSPEIEVVDSTSSSNAGRSTNFTVTKSSSSEQHLTLSQQDQAWNNNVSKTASVVLVGLGVFSSAVGFTTVFALIVSSLNRGRSTFKRIFSVLATYLVAAIRPSLLVKQQQARGKSVASSEEAEMKVTPATPIAPIISDAEGGRLSSFAFPVLSRDNSVGTPIFRVHQEVSSSHGQNQQPGQALVAAPRLNPVVTSIKVVAVSSQPGSPAFDGSKGAQRPCQKLKARIFKCHPPRKITPATSENSSADEDASEGVAESEAVINNAHEMVTESPRDSPRCKRLSFIRRRHKSKKGMDSDDQLSGHSAESEFEDVSSPSPVTRVVAVKASKSQEILTSRNPNSKEPLHDAATPNRPLKTSRSQELKLSFKNFKQRIKSHELHVPSSAANAPEIQQLALESATVDVLDKMAFPFKHDAAATDSSSPSTPTTPGPNPKPEKRRGSSLCVLKKHSNDSDKSCDLGLLSPRSSTTTTTRLSKSLTSPASRMTTDKNSVIDCKPELRKVKTTVARVPLPADQGELARSRVLDRETLGSLLVLAVLGFLLLGRIPAILGTACLCLVLSHVQRFLSNNMTPRERERLASKRDGGVGLSRLGGSSPPRSQGSPPMDVQSSEYKKKVLIEGFLDRGNRRTAA